MQHPRFEVTCFLNQAIARRLLQLATRTVKYFFPTWGPRRPDPSDISTLDGNLVLVPEAMS